MMRSLWTAASGMKTQQTNVDVISNNLANVNTTAYKAETAEFKSLLYQTIQTETTSANGENKPIGAQVGLGVRNSSITSKFTQGNLNSTGNTLDFAIDGDGFFQVMDVDGSTCYTRTGSFQITKAIGGVMLADREGRPVLDVNGEEIMFSENSDLSKMTISVTGEICMPDETNNPAPTGIVLGIVRFSNPAGLEKAGSGLYEATEASGEPTLESDMAGIKRSTLMQGYIEGSNVQVVDEMVNLIVAQRAYEMNSKAIQAADEMMGQANTLRR
ncbi:MAG: flagellar basal-body rod protein FlgG [Lachnospiraceae bacterium]|nr:flagellar basal-body rod protein FlgG [Lachnospiraceae bacterium]